MSRPKHDNIVVFPLTLKIQLNKASEKEDSPALVPFTLSMLKYSVPIQTQNLSPSPYMTNERVLPQSIISMPVQERIDLFFNAKKFVEFLREETTPAYTKEKIDDIQRIIKEYKRKLKGWKESEKIVQSQWNELKEFIQSGDFKDNVKCIFIFELGTFDIERVIDQMETLKNVIEYLKDKEFVLSDVVNSINNNTASEIEKKIKKLVDHRNDEIGKYNTSTPSPPTQKSKIDNISKIDITNSKIKHIITKFDRLTQNILNFESRLNEYNTEKDKIDSKLKAEQENKTNILVRQSHQRIEVEQKNIHLLLNALFPITLPRPKNIFATSELHTSGFSLPSTWNWGRTLDLVLLDDLFHWGLHPEEFCYLNVGGKEGTVLQTCWYNDIFHHPELLSIGTEIVGYHLWYEEKKKDVKTLISNVRDAFETAELSKDNTLNLIQYRIDNAEDIITVSSSRSSSRDQEIENLAKTYLSSLTNLKNAISTRLNAIKTMKINEKTGMDEFFKKMKELELKYKEFNQFLKNLSSSKESQSRSSSIGDSFNTRRSIDTDKKLLESNMKLLTNVLITGEAVNAISKVVKEEENDDEDEDKKQWKKQVQEGIKKYYKEYDSFKTKFKDYVDSSEKITNYTLITTIREQLENITKLNPIFEYIRSIRPTSEDDDANIGMDPPKYPFETIYSGLMRKGAAPKENVAEGAAGKAKDDMEISGGAEVGKNMTEYEIVVGIDIILGKVTQENMRSIQCGIRGEYLGTRIIQLIQRNTLDGKQRQVELRRIPLVSIDDLQGNKKEDNTGKPKNETTEEKKPDTQKPAPAQLPVKVGGGTTLIPRFHFHNARSHRQSLRPRGTRRWFHSSRS